MKYYWLIWFPHLPSYQAYNYRANQLHRPATRWHLEVMVGDLMQQLPFGDCYVYVCLTDSLPIILSKQPCQAKVALEVKGYCSTKKLYYHGLNGVARRFHFLGRDRYQRIPQPEHMQFTAASTNELTVLKTFLPHLQNRLIIGHKAFASVPLNEQLANQQVEIITPIKLKKEQKRLDAADQYLSSYITGPPGGSIRQPVESFFNWFLREDPNPNRL